jgi:hypothetical protein
MWSAIVDFFKGLIGGKGAMQIGKDNQSLSGASSGDNSPVFAVGRDLNLTLHGDGASKPKTEKEELLDWLQRNSSSEPVSQVLPQIIRLAKLVGDKSVERWARMELFGYSQDAGMTEDDKVPEYRAVVGQYYDGYDRPLNLPSNLHFLNHYRFRYGVATLEEWAKKTEMQNIQDPGFIEIFERDLKVKVVRFCFSPLGLVEIVNNVRNHALYKIEELEKQCSAS